MFASVISNADTRAHIRFCCTCNTSVLRPVSSCRVTRTSTTLACAATLCGEHRCVWPRTRTPPSIPRRLYRPRPWPHVPRLAAERGGRGLARVQRTSATPARTRARTWVETCASSILFVTRPLLACLVLELTGPYTATCLPGLTRRRRAGRAAACLAYQSDTARKAAKKRNAGGESRN